MNQMRRPQRPDTARVRRVRRLAVALLTVALGTAVTACKSGDLPVADLIQSPGVDARYLSAPDYKAIAISPGTPGIAAGGFAHGYRNTREAIDQALHECRANASTPVIAEGCVLYAIGERVVNGFHDADLEIAIEQYEAERAFNSPHAKDRCFRRTNYDTPGADLPRDLEACRTKGKAGSDAFEGCLAERGWSEGQPVPCPLPGDE